MMRLIRTVKLQTHFMACLPRMCNNNKVHLLVAAQTSKENLTVVCFYDRLWADLHHYNDYITASSQHTNTLFGVVSLPFVTKLQLLEVVQVYKANGSNTMTNVSWLCKVVHVFVFTWTLWWFDTCILAHLVGKTCNHAK